MPMHLQRHKTVAVAERKLVPLKRLKSSPLNPPSRLVTSGLRDLAESMDRIGLLYPVTVTPDWLILDGHRRVAAALMLGWKDIPVAVVNANAQEVYAAVNATGRRMTGQQFLYVWMKDPRAVPARQAQTFGRMEAMLGKELLGAFVRRGFTPRFYRYAMEVLRYVGWEEERLKQVLVWMMDKAGVGGYTIYRALLANVDPAVIRQAIERDRPLKIEAAVG